MRGCPKGLPSDQSSHRKSFMSEAKVDNGRRTWLITSAAMGGAGAAAVAVPFVSTFSPSERAKAAGASVEIDISKRIWRIPIQTVGRIPHLNTPRTATARSNLKFLWPLASAHTSVAHLQINWYLVRSHHYLMTGPVASCALATARLSTSLVVCIRTSQRPTTWRSRPTCTSPIR